MWQSIMEGVAQVPARRRARRTREGWGSIRKIDGGRYQARFWAPDPDALPDPATGERPRRQWTARTTDDEPLTFDTIDAARAYLSGQRAALGAGTWTPPGRSSTKPVMAGTFSTYAEAWIANRLVKGRPLAQRTREHYEQILRDHLVPTFGELPLAAITADAVDTWYSTLPTGPTARAHAYGLLRGIMATAVERDIIVKSPCFIRGAGQADRAREIRPATLAELEALVAAMPARYQLLTLLAAWCALRFGELTELRRSDVDLDAGVIRITRGVVRTKEHGMVTKDPKSSAGRRTVAIPPHLVPLVKSHLAEFVTGKDGLLFPSAGDPTKHLMNSAMSRVYLRARKKAGRPDLRFHDLRHTGAVLAAATGATLAELMARLGHSTPGAAMRYQHASADRDKAIAKALSALVTGTVVSIDAAKRGQTESA